MATARSHSRPTPPAVILLEDILRSLRDFYNQIPTSPEPQILKSHAARITINNLYSQILLQFQRAQISYRSHQEGLQSLRNSVILSIHRVHGTTEAAHPIGPVEDYIEIHDL